MSSQAFQEVQFNRKLTDIKESIAGLMNGSERPRDIVGSGYKNAKQVAAQWLYKEMHNLLNPTSTISQVHLTSSGTGYSSIERAMSAKPYQALLNNEYTLINDAQVISYGVIKTPNDAERFMIYVNY